MIKAVRGRTRIQGVTMAQFRHDYFQEPYPLIQILEA